MKNIFMILAAILLMIPAVVLAQNQNQNQNQQQVQNAGEETQLQNQFQEEEKEGVEDEDEEEEENEIKTGANRSEVAESKMSAVAKKVEELLSDPDLEGGIGPQIREFAQAQKQVQTEIEENETKLQKRNQLARVLLGPDYKALNSLIRLQERNTLRLQILTELATQVQNEGEAQQIEETIQLLTEQNTALAEQIMTEENQPGFLGWFFRLFAK
ncbi:hypothetical protein A2313_04690 [Candidatus Roizmanbacteria bacterium RIFOXYB2_FULL_41_10]|nr:MAG: hypothetical protein A2313_04690 [Candidatus Roizmanbacteria bacterium RIFOXYB2_FULL_41_10]